MNGNMSGLPLYRPVSEPDFSNNPNAGLWYDKFCDKWEAGWKTGLGDGGKADWVAAFSGWNIGNPDLIEETIERRMIFMEKCGGLALSFKTQGPMVSGLGRSHPVENGFAWHHLLGVPYLPGSSVKGVVRSYVTCWLDGPDKVDETDVLRIFGPRKGSIQVGSVVFLDALPVMPVRLRAEIMTPHFGPYYRGAKPEPPADWHSPVPIPFLAVDENQEFLFGVLPRGPGDNDDCQKASEWLCEALEKMGAGAKTSSGYGRFLRADLKNRGMRWLAWFARQKESNDVAAFLKKSPGTALKEWSAIENPEIKYEVAREMISIYGGMGSWGKIKETRRVLQDYLQTVRTSPEDRA